MSYSDSLVCLIIRGIFFVILFVVCLLLCLGL